jgi:hypothetical protein
MTKVSDARLVDLLKAVTHVGPHLIPPGTPCFWDTKDSRVLHVR